MTDGMQLSWPRVYLSDRDAARDLARDLALQVLESAGFGSSAAQSSCEGSVSATGGASGAAASGTAASGTAASATVFTVEADYSLTDNSEIRREILNDKWRQVFDKFDPEGFGEIPWDDLDCALRSSEMCSVVPPHKRDLLAQRAATHRQQTTAITFQDFVNLMSGKRSRSFKCAVHQRDREVSSERDFHIEPSPTPLNKMVRIIADEFLTEERDRKYYADQYTCCPPPLFILCITLIELGFFTYYSVAMGEVNSSSPVPIDSVFIYRPDKRLQVWRFLFYMVLHAGWLHLLFNLLVQLLVGLPLEMVHGSFRIGIVYMAGVLAGSLGTSVFDNEAYLVGASGGVYALLAAHLANVLLNYNNMEFGVVRLIGIFIIASADVGFAIYDRYAAEQLALNGGDATGTLTGIVNDIGPVPAFASSAYANQQYPVSYVAHLTGALAGLTIGFLVLKNFEQKLHEQLLWWFSLGVYAACTLFAILFNIFNGANPSISVPQP